MQVLHEAAPEEQEALEAFRQLSGSKLGQRKLSLSERWSVVLVAKILIRVIEEGATIALTLSVYPGMASEVKVSCQ